MTGSIRDRRRSAMRMLKILTAVAFVLVVVLILGNGTKQRGPNYSAAT